MRNRCPGVVLLALALSPSPAPAATDGPVTQLSASGGRPDVIARADGSAIAVWEEKPSATTSSVRFCRIAAGAGVCTAGTERTLASVAGATTSRPFVFDLSGTNRIVVVHGGTTPQRTNRWVSADGGATFPASGTDFASVVPFDQGATVGPGDMISLLGAPAAGTVRFQQAPVSGAKTTAEATLEAAGAATAAHAVSIDPATSRPFALWASATQASSSSATSANANLTASWAAPAVLAGVTGVRLAGTFATWVRDGRHEVARWTGGSFSAGAPLPHTPADNGEADIAADGSGGLHVVFSPPASGAVCHAHAPDGSAFSAPRLLGRDTAGVSGLQISATGPGAGRVAFGSPTGGVSVLPLSAPGLIPNVCGLAPAGLALVKGIGAGSVHVTVDPNGQDATYRVEHGPTADYGTSTPETAAPAAVGKAAGSVELGSLAPGTTYHARIVATNATGTAAGPDVTFTTPSVLAPLRASTLIRLPATCTRRRLTVTLPARDGVTAVAAVIRATGHKPLRLGPKKLAARRFTLTKLTRSAVRARVKLKLADGRILSASRRYRGCA